MSEDRVPKAAPRTYSPEFRARAMRLVTETVEAEGRSQGVVTRIASQLGMPSETLHSWLRRAGRDGWRQPGTEELAARVETLERENRELRRANEILKTASAFFAAELDRPEKR